MGDRARRGPHTNIHVGLQVRKDPVDLVPADAAAALWTTDLQTDGGDFRGPRRARVQPTTITVRPPEAATAPAPGTGS